MPSRSAERRVDLHGLAGDAELLLGRQPVQGAHVVEPVGELDEDDPDVLGHRQEHLPDVLGLLLLVAVGREARQLGHAIDEVGDLCAEALLDVGQAVFGVLGDVVEQGSLDGDRSMPSSARICAEAIGCETYGSPVARRCPSCASTARSKARSTPARSAVGWCSTTDALSAVRSASRSDPCGVPGRAGTVRRGPRRAGVLAVFFGAAGAEGLLVLAACRAGADARSALVVDAADAPDAVLPRVAAMRRKDSSESPFSRRSRMPGPPGRRDTRQRPRSRRQPASRDRRVRRARSHRA